MHHVQAAALRFRLFQVLSPASPLPHISTLMAAPQIPNLLSLRGGPRSRGGRGRGRGHSAGGADHGISGVGARNRKDLDIQSTDTDAAVSRLSVVSLGYLHDPYASFFVNGPGIRRLPIINRGVLLQLDLEYSVDIARNLHKNHSSRYPYKRLPLTLRPRLSANEANNLPRRRHRHSIFPLTIAK